MMNQKKQNETKKKSKHKQNEVMKSNPHPVVERKWCNRSRVNSHLQESATSQQSSL